MRTLTLATIAGAALLVAACGGGAANNTANAPADNGNAMGNDMMAPTDMNAMPAADNNAMAAPAANAAAPAANTTNAM